MGCGCKHDAGSDDMLLARGGLPWVGRQLGNHHDPRPPRPKRRRVPPPVTLRLLSRREVIFDGRASTVETVPLPTFDTAAFGRWVLSVAVAVKTGYLAGNQLKVWIQNVVTDPDNPAQVFVGDGPSVTITASPAAPQLLTSISDTFVGPQARLALQWTQGPIGFSPPGSPVAQTVLSAWVTLKPKSRPPIT